jgi:carbon monoxide dehydrogenase subunit G
MASDVVVERTINAPMERVWQLLTTLESIAQTVDVIEKTEVLTPGSFDVGTRWRETRRLVKGVKATDELKVLECEAPSRYLVETGRGGVRYLTECVLSSGEEKTTVARMTMRTGTSGSLARVFVGVSGRIADKIVAKGFEQELADIARAAETSS